MKKKTYYYEIAYLYHKSQIIESVGTVSSYSSCISKAKREFEKKYSITILKISRN